MIPDTIRRFLDAHGIDGPIVVAVSGGPDSTALLLAIVEIAEITAAHINHHLRGEESEADEAFVRQLCAQRGIALRVADGSLDPRLVRERGIEAAAREVRHARLQQIRAEVGAKYIATAHQKNDQAETVLMRLMTGGGLAALRGIHPVREDGMIRPLLEVSRADIEQFLRERGVGARVDRMNTDPRFLRNRVRVLLAQFEPRVIDNLAAVASQAREQWAILERLIDTVDTSVQTESETRFAAMPSESWLRQALLHRHIRRLEPAARDVSSLDLERLAAELDSLKRVSVTRSLELLRQGGDWILRRKPEPVDPFELELRAGEEVYVPEIRATLRVRRAGITGNRQPSGGVIPSRGDGEESPMQGRRGSLAPLGMTPSATQRFQLPLGADAQFTIRNRRQGDRFQPLGMSRQKKLKDFLIDRKISVEHRDRIPLLVWNGKIVWVGGVEISEAFKVTDGGGELYEVAIEEKSQEDVQREADRQSRQ